MTVIRIPKRKRFVVMAVEIVEDPRLSWRAKGVMTYLLSRPDAWEVRVVDLVKRSTEGRDAVYKVVAELLEFGHLRRVEVRDGGRFSRYDYVVCERPEESEATVVPLPENQETAEGTNDSPLPRKPDTVLPYTANPDDIKEELVVKTDSKEESFFSNEPDAGTPSPSPKKTSTRKTEDPAKASLVGALVAFFVDTAKSYGKTGLTAKSEVARLGRAVREQIEAETPPEVVAEAIRRAVRSNRPGNLPALVAGVQEQDGRAILPFEHPISEDLRDLNARRDSGPRDGEPTPLAEVFAPLGSGSVEAPE